MRTDIVLNRKAECVTTTKNRKLYHKWRHYAINILYLTAVYKFWYEKFLKNFKLEVPSAYAVNQVDDYRDSDNVINLIPYLDEGKA